MPVRKVLGYDDLRALALKQKAIDYLLKTEFDFVVYKKENDVPILAVEFDGLGYGFSSNGEYVLHRECLNDPYRELKLDCKLKACELTGMPLVIVSFPETFPLKESNSAITVLDAIIGEVKSSLGLQELIQKHTGTFYDAFNDDPSGNIVEEILWTSESQSEIENNPIRRRTLEMSNRLPIDIGLWIERPLRDRAGYIGIRKVIIGGVNGNKRQILLSVSVYVRDLNCNGCSTVNLADCIAEYCLAKKALDEIGTNPVDWRRLMRETPYTSKVL